MKRLIPVLLVLALIVPMIVFAEEKVERREEGNLVIEGIPEPESVAEAIRAHMRTMRRKSMFIEQL